MPKVIQINPVVKNGSTGRIVEQIGLVAINGGWESYIAYGGRPRNTSKSRLIKIGTYFDQLIHALHTRFFDNHGFASVHATKRFIKILEQIKPDLIHLHNIHGYFLNLTILFDYIVNKGIPVIWTLHDFWPVTGHCSFFSDINCEKWKAGCHHCPKKKYYPKSICIDNSEKNYYLKRKIFCSLKNISIISVSKWEENILRQSYLSKYPIFTIYNGVDLEIFKPMGGTDSLRSKLKIANKYVLLALATTWGARKGWYDYLKLSKILPEEYIIVLVGLPWRKMKDLPKNIMGIKRTESVNELVSYYSMADIVLNLSYQETFGLTTVEGLACGTPCIVYNRTASPELIIPETGYIVEPGNIEQILQAIQRIVKNGKLHYSENCRLHAMRYFDVNDRYLEYLELYRSLIN
jgi:putative colanic acid biosynthesis glycosyltransferase